jgi:long-chain acyl-CoA synthetase
MSDQPWIKSYPAGSSWDIEVPNTPITHLLDNAVAQWPNNVALDFLGKKVSYADLGDLVDRAAKGFQEIGVGPGVHVGLFLPNVPHTVIAFFAILKAGGTVVNYSPLDAERELRHKIEDSHTDIMVTLSLKALYPTVGKLLRDTRLKKVVVGGIQEFLPFPKSLLFPLVKGKEIADVPQDADHIPFKQLIGNDGRVSTPDIGDPSETLAVLQYTGGTTGVPKGAMLTHGNLMAAYTQFSSFNDGDERVAIPGEETILAVLPLFHIYALTLILLFGIGGGAQIILHPRFELDDVMKDLHGKKPTIFPGVPTMYTAIINHPKITEHDLSSLKFCASGGAPLPLEVQQRFQNITGCKLVEGWGMTETAPAGCSTPVHGVYKEGSCGIPLPGITMAIYDIEDPTKALGLNETGEICIKGPNVMKAYWEKPEATAESLNADGFFRTGDTGYMDDDGYIFIVDRLKDMLTCSGYNVYPRNIEEAIYLHTAVEEVTVIGIPDDYRGQAPKAFIKLKDGATAFNLDELQEFLSDKLGRHEMVSEMDIRPELPKTLVGKLSKKELVEEEEKKRANAA